MKPTVIEYLVIFAIIFMLIGAWTQPSYSEKQILSRMDQNKSCLMALHEEFIKSGGTYTPHKECQDLLGKYFDIQITEDGTAESQAIDFPKKECFFLRIEKNGKKYPPKCWE